MAHSTRILTARPNNTTILIKPSGPCCMGSCAALKSFINTFKKPAHTDIFVDLSAAESIDSTFTGLLLSFARKKADSPVPDLHLVSPTPRVVDALKGMHLTSLFDIRETMPTASNWKEIELDWNAGDLANTVLNSHRELIDADSRNAAEFGRVVEGLEADPHRTPPPVDP